VDQHPNREVIFLDNSIELVFFGDVNDPDLNYHVGTSLSERVKNKIEDFEPSVIHITVPDQTALHLIQFGRQKEIPLMGTYHSNIPEYMDYYRGVSWLKYIFAAYFRHEYNFLQHLYVPTPFIRKYLADTYQTDKVTSLRVWGRGIDLQKFSPSHRSQKFRQSLGIEEHEVVICWVGRFVPEKKPDIFAYVVKRLYEEGVPFKTIMIGSGCVQDEYAKLPNTHMLGWMSGNELSVAYASCDVFLFPSSVETFGNVTLEAAASGLPVVVHEDCSGHLVRDEFNGFACNFDDNEQWYDATLALVKDDALRREYSRNSRKLSLNFELKTTVLKMIDNYATVADEFYKDYEGHHRNRDALYDTENSFRMGNIPRSFLYSIIEVTVNTLVRSLTAFLLAMLWLKNLFCSKKLNHYTSTSSSTVTLTKKNVDYPLKPELTSIKTNSSFCTDDTLSDDGSDTTSSTLSTSSESSSMNSSSCSSMSISDVANNIGAPLAIGFVKVVEFTLRTECKIRNLCSSKQPSEKFRSHRKRKNSEFTQLERRRGSLENDSPKRATRMRRSTSLHSANNV
jgi:phosphatidylinositol alpha 1,6-mannosyltransferase